MSDSSLARFVAAVRADWGPLNTLLVARCRKHLDALTGASAHEGWLQGLLAERPATCELHREAANGFMLLAHSEQQDLYRPPHDHGRAWVVYGVQSGELEVGTYVKVMDDDGHRLVKRETVVLRPGKARAYLPGDIHDTRCLTPNALVFRFTERDLRHEDQVEHMVSRFVKRDAEWLSARP